MQSEILFLFDLMSDIYMKPVGSPSIDNISLPKVLELASKNGVLYYTVDKLLEKYGGKFDKHTYTWLFRIKNEEKIGLERLGKTAELINSCLNEYLIFKTHKGYPHVTHDVDVIVKDLPKSVETLVRVGKASLIEWHSIDDTAVLKRKDCLRIHLYEKVSWCMQKFFDDELAWKDAREVVLAGTKIKVMIPSVECEFLSQIAHANFEPLCIPLSDLMYLFTLIPEINWDIVIEQAKKYSWYGTLCRTLSIINYVHEDVYSKPCIPWEELRLVRKMKSIKLPLQFTLNHIIASLAEKGALVEFILSLISSLRIFLSREVILRLKSRLEALL
jgi:hypothetical protein